MKHSSIAIIPARGGSKRVPRKNVRHLNGQPLINHTITSAKSANLVSRTVVSTDDEEIAQIATNAGAEVIIRPSELASDTAKSIDVIIHALDKLIDYHERSTTDIVVLQPTTPFRPSDLIDNAIELLRNTGCHSVVSYYRMDYPHPNRAKKLSHGGRIVPYCEPEITNVPRGELPEAYYRDGAIYACDSTVPYKFSNLFGTDQRALIVDETINIDTEMDWAMAEYLIRNNKKP